MARQPYIYKTYKPISYFKNLIEDLTQNINAQQKKYDSLIEQQAIQDAERTFKNISFLQNQFQENQSKLEKLLQRKEELIEKFNKDGFTLINNIPDNFLYYQDDLKLQLQCKTCNEIILRTLMEYQDAHKCLACAKQKKLNKYIEKRKTTNAEKIEELFINLYPEAKLLSEITGAVNEEVTIQCERGHVFKSTINRIKFTFNKGNSNGQWCPKCKDNKLPKYIENNPNAITTKQQPIAKMKLDHNLELLGIRLISKYTAKHEKHMFKCKVCGKEIFKTPDEIIYQFDRIKKNGLCSPQCKQKLIRLPKLFFKQL